MENQDSKKIKVIDSFWTFFVALALIGPFALPLLWRNSRLSLSVKVTGSIGIVALTGALVLFTGSWMGEMSARLQQLKMIQESSP